MDNPQLAQQLAEFCRQRGTGTLIGLTKQGASLMIAVKEGVIVGLSFRNITGVAALALIRDETDCNVNVRENLVMRADSNLPPTEHILNELKVGTDAVSGVTGADALPALNAASADGYQILSIIETEAGSLFGPIAGVIVKEQLAGNPPLNTLDDFRALLRSIAAGAEREDLVGQLISRVMESASLEQRRKKRR